MRSLSARGLATVVLLAWCCVGDAHAQGGNAASPGRANITREALMALLTQAEIAQTSAAYSQLLRDRAATQAANIRRRLEEGDFRPGDQVVLDVVGEPSLTGTFPVQSGSRLSLPGVGDIQLRGVLRSELSGHLTGELRKYLRNPEVRAQSQFRIVVSGAVAKPGYYDVAAESLVSEVVMLAGGFTTTADLENLEIQRGNQTIWTASDMQTAIAGGQTFDEMSLTAGDHLIVGQLPTGNRFASVQSVVMTVPAMLVAITAILQIF